SQRAALQHHQLQRVRTVAGNGPDAVEPTATAATARQQKSSDRIAHKGGRGPRVKHQAIASPGGLRGRLRKCGIWHSENWLARRSTAIWFSRFSFSDEPFSLRPLRHAG